MKVSRRRFLTAAGAGAIALASVDRLLAQATTRPGRKPNFVIIFTDDQGYQDLGCFGSRDIRTPCIDRMAAEGMKFTNFYVPAPCCSPSRAGLMTGCYPKRVGMHQGVLFPSSRTGLNPDEITLARLLNNAGYATACIGKWHLGHRDKFLPTRHGFDEYFGIPYSNDMSLDVEGSQFAPDCNWREGFTAANVAEKKASNSQAPLMRGEQVVEFPVDQTTLTERYTGAAVDFITRNRDKPFLLYLPHSMPHLPLAVSEKFRGKSAGGLYGDVIECIDWSTGQIVETLKKLGLAEDTVVVFTSDNGPWTHLRKGKNVGFANPLRAGKNTTYEGGMRVPCVMWAPGRIPAGKTCDDLATVIDLYPTFAAMAGVELPAGRAIDGLDIATLMTSRPGARSPHEAFFYYSSGGKLEGVRRGNWKLLVYQKPELYDLKADIGERHNLADQHPELVRELRKLMDDFDRELTRNARPIGRLAGARK